MNRNSVTLGSLLALAFSILCATAEPCFAQCCSSVCSPYRVSYCAPTCSSCCVPYRVSYWPLFSAYTACYVPACAPTCAPACAPACAPTCAPACSSGCAPVATPVPATVPTYVEPAQTRIQPFRSRLTSRPLVSPPMTPAVRVTSGIISKPSSVDRSKVAPQSVKFPTQAARGMSSEEGKGNQDWTPVQSPAKIAVRTEARRP